MEWLQEAAAAPAADGNSFVEIAREWLVARQLARAPKYAAHIIRRLEADVFPVVGEKDIREIKPRDLLDIFQAIQAHISLEMAHRIKNTAAKSFATPVPTGAATARMRGLFYSASSMPHDARERPRPKIDPPTGPVSVAVVRLRHHIKTAPLQ
ncbi:phage integrase central domain-containing protein [Sphingopyxis sp.]|uniref:phage integrase central domain-containing protein n=1 Tax=Sphingopyxis sp. TaxID=1908224 RepID=UPI002B459119|nr:hypothetical protein [Sphingopyxis sp.]